MISNPKCVQKFAARLSAMPREATPMDSTSRNRRYGSEEDDEDDAVLSCEVVTDTPGVIQSIVKDVPNEGGILVS
jgi:hypothetical protein